MRVLLRAVVCLGFVAGCDLALGLERRVPSDVHVDAPVASVTDLAVTGPFGPMAIDDVGAVTAVVRGVANTVATYELAASRGTLSPDNGMVELDGNGRAMLVAQLVAPTTPGMVMITASANGGAATSLQVPILGLAIVGRDGMGAEIRPVTREHVVGARLQLATQVTLRTIGLWTNGPLGTPARMGVYASNGPGPGALIFGTQAQQLLGNRNEWKVGPIPLGPGTYWLLGMFDADSGISYDSPSAGASMLSVQPHMFSVGMPASITSYITDSYDLACFMIVAL